MRHIPSLGRMVVQRCLFLLVANTTIVATGCLPQVSDHRNGYEKVSDPAVTELVAAIPRARKAVLQDGSLYIEYQHTGVMHHAMVKAQPLDSTSEHSHAPHLPVSTLRHAVVDSLVHDSAEAVPVTVLDHEAWQALLYSTLEGLTPGQRGHGACVDLLQEQELFVYRDSDGSVVSVPLVYKPGDVTVSRAYSYNELLTHMSERLDTGAVSADHLLFETGDDNAYGYPFVFVDQAAGRIIFLQHIPTDTSGYVDLPVDTTLEILARTISDHFFGVINQPVSSITRLLSMVSVTTFDIMRPTPLLLTSSNPVTPVGGQDGMDLAAWEVRLDTLSGSTQTLGRMTLLVDGQAFFPRLIDAISAADNAVDLRMYIFDNDDYAISIAELLKHRSSTIDVRVLVDGLGTLGAEMGEASSASPGGPSTSSIARYLKRDSNVQVRSVSNVWLAGDHTKTIIVDDRIAFLGGMNIGREYRYDWHDMMVEVEGPIVAEIAQDFERAWASSGFLGDLQRLGRLVHVSDEHPDIQGYPLRLLYTRPGDSQILRAQIEATRRARHHIYLQNPYITSDAMLYELVKARQRGVDVRVIMPYQNDNGIIARSNVVVANAMLKHGIRVYIYPGMSHLKAAIYDGWACLGSANMDNLSLRRNREMNLATSHPPAVDALREQVFDVDIARSIELTEPLPGNWSDYLAELLADSL